MPILPTKRKDKLLKKFEKFAEKTNVIVGSPYWFIFSIIVILIWLPSGYFLGWGEIWHLLINTTTTILTFLMMSLLHSTQSRWEERMEKMQQKEDTGIRAIEKTTKKLAYDKGEKPIKPKDIDLEDILKEEINSIH